MIGYSKMQIQLQSKLSMILNLTHKIDYTSIIAVRSNLVLAIKHMTSTQRMGPRLVSGFVFGEQKIDAPLLL